ncbi:hypothetical protein AB0K00_04910 [Dactylosporangium sp. NPDC049525]|uniref:hypothetical protein n=1 Tax=Dactylosporangium sp. NPDC049525 TaxID=3154730 RepID=UPI0034406F9E
MEDARLVPATPASSRLHATAALIEALGSQIVVHFTIDAPRVVTEDTRLLAREAQTEDLPTAHATKFVAAFAPRSRVRLGERLEIVVDTERMHFFDPITGQAIR